jgi:hypothetical protein
MIHQFIFAGPRPGLTAEAFQSYWVNFHAVDYAAKIPQIRGYSVATKLTTQLERELPFFQGVAEIWLANEAEQLASLQSPEFLQGARADEPRWAAFWRTLVVDTDAVLLSGRPEADRATTTLYTLLKRDARLSRDEFWAHLEAEQATRVSELPGLERHILGRSSENQYGLGEPRFDAVEVLAFEDAAQLESALRSDTFARVTSGWASVWDERYTFFFAALSHWIIRPPDNAV